MRREWVGGRCRAERGLFLCALLVKGGGREERGKLWDDDESLGVGVGPGV